MPLSARNTVRDFTFGRCVIRTSARQLLIDDRPAKLGARAYDVLLALIDRRDRTVTKSELLDIVWPDLVIEENNLQVHIWTLRKLLGPQAIATIPRGAVFASRQHLHRMLIPRTRRRHGRARQSDSLLKLQPCYSAVTMT